MRFTPSLRFFRRNPATSPDADPADMGTAFGMEASLDGSEDYRYASAEPELESQRLARTQESPLAWLSAKRHN
ncbi:hypothetical protein DBR47_11110 [Paucibacter sp. KBW04]|uniref:hypothetical protein n=1 Tax=Paucibacter sp. KBW04 TaxID=2153361 RepID=UPI000F5797E5|nr:hypothetical protein [Paucibacter sp. KBW04]RQO59906.1 hypothetical protein DBR47_11110 [Paucibacter sp. KBW04]